MYELAIASDRERAFVFENCASKMGIHTALVEKDFWVS